MVRAACLPGLAELGLISNWLQPVFFTVVVKALCLIDAVRLLAQLRLINIPYVLVIERCLQPASSSRKH
jgi:hypothetical protein